MCGKIVIKNLIYSENIKKLECLSEITAGG